MVQKSLERRKFERFSARFPAKYKDTRDDYGASVFLRDASAAGVRLVCRDRLYLNDHVSLEVELPDHKNPMEIRGEVQWVEHSELNVWEAGLKLHQTDLLCMSRLYKFTLA